MSEYVAGGLVGRLAEHAERDPNRRALSFAPAHLDGKRVELTYGELLAATRATARALAERLRPGDRALLLFPTTHEFAPAFLGCLAAGVIAVPVPLPVDEGAQRRVLNVARDCDVSLIVSMSFIHDFVRAGAPEVRELGESYDWLLVDQLERPSGPDDGAGLPVAAAEDIAFLQYTSGSTSTPRGVLVSHGGLMHNEVAIQRSFGVTADSTIVSWLPLHHDMGLIGAMLQPLHTGARGVILDPLSFVRRPASWLEVVSQERADISGGPNFAYDLCVRKVTEQEKAGLDLSNWRVAFNGAAQVYPRTLRAFSEAFRDTGFRPSSHLPCYGLAESTLLVTTADPAGSRTFGVDSLESGQPLEQADGRELIAYHLPEHADLRVLDPAGSTPVADGLTGEIVVSGGSNGSGYWASPDASAATFGVKVPGVAEPFLRTGDLGFVHNGALHIVGRAKDLIVQRGRNLYPEDLEADISICHPEVRPGRCAVFGVDHDGDEAVVVCQEVRQDTSADRYPEVVTAIRETLSRVHGVTARTVLLVSPGTITKTSSGKVQRHAAKQRYLGDVLPVLLADTIGAEDLDPTRSLADRLTSADPGADTLTEALCDHLHEVLGLSDRPTGAVSLAALGADSMIAVRLRHELEEALGIALRPSVTLRAGSIAELAAECAAAPVVAAPVADHEDGYELNAAQQALWFLHRALPDGGDYNVTRAFRVTGAVDAEAFGAALDAVVRRHPSLRLTVRTADGMPRGVLREDAHVELETTSGAEAEADWYRELATRPFDLEHGPLLRAALRRRDEDWLFVLSLHHIVCDVSSFAIVVADLAAELSGAAPAARTPVSPAERERIALRERGDDLAEYWRTELAGELPTLALPEPGRADTAPGTRTALAFDADADLTAALTRFAKERGLTLHNLLLGAYQVLLHRLSGQADLLVGVPTAGRADRRLADWVGYLVNVVPVRSSYAPDATFAEFVAGTQERVLDALDHADLPLSHITRIVNPDRENAAATIFQAMFTCYTTALPGGAAVAAAVMGDADAEVPLGAATLHGHPVPDHTTQSDLGLNVAVGRDTLGFQLQYDPATVSREQAEQVSTTFMTLLAAVGAHPETAVRKLPLLSTDEIAELVRRGIGPDIARPGNYLDSFEDVVDRFPDSIAVDDGAVRLTYAELDARANHVADRLRAQGVAVDGNVVVSAARSVDYLVALVGLHKADGCYVPISPREAPKRAAAMVAAVAPAAAIADATGRDLLAGALEAGGSDRAPLDLAELVAGHQVARPPRVCPDHAASTIIHTSGSTGVPKAAVSTNYGVTNHMWQMVEHFGLGRSDCVAQTAPVSFDISVWQLLTPLMVGGRVRIVPEPTSQSPSGLLRATVEGGVTMLELVPSNIVALLDAGLADTHGALRVMLSTGEALTGDVLRRWVRELPHIPVHNAYGPAECTDDVTAGLCAAGPDAPMTTSVGRPLANTSVFVLDDDLVPVPPGVVGLLHVGGGAVGRGYRGNPRRTGQSFVPDPWSRTPGGRLYRTGDLARANTDGDIEFLGRADTQIKIRGQRIEAGEVEAALRELPGVVEAAVKVHKGHTGVSLVGYVATGEEAADPDGEARVLDVDEDERFRAALAEHLPRFMIPTILAALPRLPRSKNGKVDYPSLRFAAPAGTSSGPAEQLDDPLAVAVRSLWAALLERDAVGWDDSFFQLGGHSLLALAMIDRVNQLLDVRLVVDAVFAKPRLRDFVDAVRRADPATPARSATADRTPVDPSLPVPASAAQQRFWFLHEIDPGRPTYNMPGVLRMRGRLDEDALDAALHEALSRHPVLLARFTTDDGELTWTARHADEFELARLDLRGPVAEFGEEVFDNLMADEAEIVADLRRDLPFRALLARLGEEDWGLFVTIDHIVCDGWSLTVFLTDLAEGYNRRVADGTPSDRPAGYGFADYCRDERIWWDNRDRAEIAALWDGVVGPTVSRSPLPDRATSPTGSDQGAGRHADVIDGDLAEAVRELAGRTGTTPYIVFATALSALAHSGSPDRESIVLGTVIAQRDRPEWRQVVGPLLNVSVLAVDLGLADPLTEALSRTRDGALRAYRSANVPFQELVPLLAAAPDGDGSPFDVMLVMQPADRPIEFTGLATELRDVDTDAAPYPLLVDIEERDAAYRVSYRYQTGRYDAADVEELAVRLRTAVRALATGDGRSLGELVPACDALPAERN